MKIKSITRLVTFGNYENMSMCAEVEEGDDYKEVALRIEIMIKEFVDERNAYAGMLEEKAVLRNEIQQLKSDLNYAETKKGKLIELVKGIKGADELLNFEDDLPF